MQSSCSRCGIWAAPNGKDGVTMWDYACRGLRAKVMEKPSSSTCVSLSVLPWASPYPLRVHSHDLYKEEIFLQPRDTCKTLRASQWENTESSGTCVGVQFLVKSFDQSYCTAAVTESDQLCCDLLRAHNWPSLNCSSLHQDLQAQSSPSEKLHGLLLTAAPP